MYGECPASVFFSSLLGGTEKDGELSAVQRERERKKMGSDLSLALQELDRTAAIDGGVALLLFGQ